MSKVITFSRTFPGYHPKKGQPTHFAEKVMNSLNIAYREEDAQLLAANAEQIKSGRLTHSDISKFRLELDMWNTDDKHHTIRAGHRFKVGDKFSPRVWSDRPYNSKQIVLAPDVEVVKTWRFEIKKVNDGGLYSYEMFINGLITKYVPEVIQNDGLSIQDFIDWFKMDSAWKFQKPVLFSGQIICWNKEINY